MTAAQVHEYNMWVAFIVVGLPLLVVFGQGLILHMAIALAALALFFSHPAIAIALAVLWLIPWRWFWAGLFVGEGLRLSGVFGRLSRRSRYPRRTRWTDAELVRHDEQMHRAPPRLRGRRPQDYQPWDDTIDVG
jgi:hypothetical protein